MDADFDIPWVEKYRPKTLDEIVGHEEIIKRLKAYAQKKSIPNMIFAGPAGTGKTTAAIALAREIFGEYFEDNFLELNASVSKNTPILVRINGKIVRANFEELDKMYFKGNETYVETSNLEVLTLDKNFRVRWGRVKYLIRHFAKKILRIKLEGGGTLELTGNHSVMILDDNGNLVTKHAKDLKPGDYLISFVTNLDGKVREIDVDAEVYNNTSRTVLLQRLELNENLGWALGLYAAEGAIGFKGFTSGQVIYTVNYPNKTGFIGRIKGIAEDLGISYYINLTSSGFDRSRKSATQIRLLSTQLARAFGKWFYDSKSNARNDRSKRIPYFIYNTPVNVRLAFLRGLVDGDGSGQWGNVVRISSTSKDLLIDAAWLSRISGIESSIYNEEARLIWKADMKYKKSDLLPATPFVRFFEKIESKIKVNWKYILRHQLYEKKERISKEKLLYILRNVDLDNLSSEERKEYEKLLALATSDVHVIKIKSIEIVDYNDYVYDVSVPGNEMFFAGEIPVLLHNSDERGINVIREKIKEFARTAPVGGAKFKIIFLDEASEMTPDAQQALRRIMEKYATVTRFILSCNYLSRIIDPIQSRCVIFKFNRLKDEDIAKRLQYIAEHEGLTITEDGMKAILYVAEGDMRRAINTLQAAAAIDKVITAENVYKVVAVARPEDIKQMLNAAMRGDFMVAREKLHYIFSEYGVSAEDVLKQLYRELLNTPMDERLRMEIVDKLGDYDYRITIGAHPVIQLEAFLAWLAGKFKGAKV
jgi:replication factor C small subunit